MTFYIFSKPKVQEYPLIISISNAASRLQYNVKIITQNIDEKLKDTLVKRGISVVSQSNPERQNVFLKLIHWFKFGSFAKKAYFSTHPEDIIWVTGADTAICLGIKTLTKRRFIFQINELYDKNPVYLRFIRKIAAVSATNVVPEKNRASIFRAWFNLAEKPFVLPNYTYIDDSIIEDGIKYCENYLDRIAEEKKQGKYILLYQGLLRPDRDFSKVLETAEQRSNTIIVIMGCDCGMIKQYRKICPKLIYIPPIPSPYHLSVTKAADVGLAVYLPDSLNNTYCAPNKIWEYSKYGLAILGNNVPGLDVVSERGIGRQANIDDYDDISKQLDIIFECLDNFKTKSRHFYEELDFCGEFAKILQNSQK